jgi:hypothetical protein
LSHDWRPTNAHDDHEQINKAREAAEALFTSKKQVPGTEAPTSVPLAPSQVEQPAQRMPRIIAIPATMPMADKTVVPATEPKPERETRRRRAKVRVNQYGRVRALALYGMSVAEVADLYRVPVEVIERIVADGPDDHSSAS